MAIFVVLSTVTCAPIGTFSYAAGGDGSVRRYVDPGYDAVAHPTDPGATASFDPVAHHPPDLIEIRLGSWEPDVPSVDLFIGAFVADASDADFFRLDLTLRGLINPPGDVRPASFQPFRYGPNPLYGFVEIDMDENVNTGGELIAPQYRYLGNVVRFGGRISDGPLVGREAIDTSAFDDDITTDPKVDRSGEEFHLAFLGGEFSTSQIERIAGDADAVFETGETWQITAPFFHRAHGFEDFSFVEGGLLPGEYMPDVTVQFHHDLPNDETIVSLVFALTQKGAGKQGNLPPEPWDFDPTNQVSIEEALSDLQVSAEFFEKFPTGDPNEAEIRAWANQDPLESLEPESWRVTALLGSSYSAPVPDGVFYVWSDIYPNVFLGDVSGDEETGDDDIAEIEQYLEDHDLDDGILDGIVVIEGFASDFSLFDVNQDGRVHGLDLLCDQADGDGDDDGRVDLRDFAQLQNCVNVGALAESECVAPDINLSGVTDADDLPWFIAVMKGPLRR